MKSIKRGSVTRRGNPTTPYPVEYRTDNGNGPYWGFTAEGKFYPFGSREFAEQSAVRPNCWQIFGGSPLSDCGPNQDPDKETVVEPEHEYSFVSRYDEIDYIRVVREAPSRTPFIFVETRTRKNQAVEYAVFVHNSILEDESIEGMPLGYQKGERGQKIGTNWGYDILEEFTNREGRIYSYRGIAGTGSVPGYIKQQIEGIKRRLNPKDHKTTVVYV